tara:strand:- start:639 stop:1547 length:909 start_codon:yes stop_codon:yes gene_type:complete
MNDQDQRICILGGGWSNEREISLKSSKAVYDSLRSNGHNVYFYDMHKDSFSELELFVNKYSINLVFNLIHGEGGEDGKIQNYLDRLGIKYSGSNSSSSEISFNKYLTKEEWVKNNLITPEYELFNNQSYHFLSSKYTVPFFIKDICSGSSNNIFLITNNSEFNSFVHNHDVTRKYMIEKKIEADEYTAAIIHNEVLPIIKITPTNTFYDYDAKYKSDKTKFTFPNLNEVILNKVKTNVVRAFNILGCSTWARVDFFIKNNDIILLEINTIPGMTDHSLVPKSANKIGINYYQLILKILNINA